MKAPRSRESALRLAGQVGWTDEDYLAAVLSRKVASLAEASNVVLLGPPGPSIPVYRGQIQPGGF